MTPPALRPGLRLLYDLGVPFVKGRIFRQPLEVIELPDGQWCAFEIKLGANQIDAAAENLLEIKRQIEADPKGRPPAVLCVLCGMAHAAYQRPDGVFVVPVTALRE